MQATYATQAKRLVQGPLPVSPRALRHVSAPDCRPGRFAAAAAAELSASSRLISCSASAASRSATCTCRAITILSHPVNIHTNNSRSVLHREKPLRVCSPASSRTRKQWTRHDPTPCYKAPGNALALLDPLPSCLKTQVMPTAHQPRIPTQSTKTVTAPTYAAHLPARVGVQGRSQWVIELCQRGRQPSLRHLRAARRQRPWLQHIPPAEQVHIVQSAMCQGAVCDAMHHALQLMMSITTRFHHKCTAVDADALHTLLLQPSAR
jgi:hypothetical protein